MTPLAEFIARQNRRGFAVGQSDIKTDSVDFVYREEKFNFPSMRVYGYCVPNGSFYLAKVKVLRKLQKQH